MKKRLLIVLISTLLVLFSAVPVMAYSSYPDFPKKSVTIGNEKFKLKKGNTGYYWIGYDKRDGEKIEKTKICSFKKKNRKHVYGEIGFVRNSRVYINICKNNKYRLLVYDATPGILITRPIGASIMAAGKNVNYFIGAKRRTNKPTELYAFKYSKKYGYVSWCKLGKYCAFPEGDDDELYFSKYHSSKSFVGCKVYLLHQDQNGDMMLWNRYNFKKSYGSVKPFEYLSYGIFYYHNGKPKSVFY